MLLPRCSATVADELHRAPARLVVVAQEEPVSGRAGQQPADRAVQRACVAAGEVAAGGAVVGHEQRVADEDRLFRHHRPTT